MIIVRDTFFYTTCMAVFSLNHQKFSIYVQKKNYAENIHEKSPFHLIIRHILALIQYKTQKP